MKEDYGNRLFTVKSTFQKGDKTFQLPFAQTPMAEVSGGSSGTNTLIVPRVISTSESSFPLSYSGATRIFMNLGYGSNISGTWKLENTGSTAGTFLTSTPLTGHLWFSTFGKGTTSRSFDLNFSTPKETYFTAPTGYNSKNLWHYLKKFIEEGDSDRVDKLREWERKLLNVTMLGAYKTLPRSTFIFIQSEKANKYTIYLSIVDSIAGGVMELKNNFCLDRFGREYKKRNTNLYIDYLIKQAIDDVYPVKINSPTYFLLEIHVFWGMKKHMQQYLYGENLL